MDNHNEPTYENQVWHAERLLKESGPEALYSPHAATGKICGCETCFCCAALQVYKQWEAEG